MKMAVHDDLDGLWAEAIGLPGCFATGATLVELGENMAEAVALYTAVAR